MTQSVTQSVSEIEKQLDRMIDLGYPDIADMTAGAFRSLADPLLHALEQVDLGTDILLVPTRELVSPEVLISRTSIQRRGGFTTMPPRDVLGFLPQDGFEPPEGPFYLVVDPHTGTAYTNREPDVARRLIDSDHRHPASGLVDGEERFQSSGLPQRGRPVSQRLAEPGGSALGGRMAEQ